MIYDLYEDQQQRIMNMMHSLHIEERWAYKGFFIYLLYTHKEGVKR